MAKVTCSKCKGKGEYIHVNMIQQAHCICSICKGSGKITVKDSEVENGQMKIYLLFQTENTDYDTYDSMVVVAKSKDDARLMHPYDYPENSLSPWADKFVDSWASSPDNVKVKYLGNASPEFKEPTTILKSFNAG